MVAYKIKYKYDNITKTESIYYKSVLTVNNNVKLKKKRSENYKKSS